MLRTKQKHWIQALAMSSTAARSQLGAADSLRCCCCCCCWRRQQWCRCCCLATTHVVASRDVSEHSDFRISWLHCISWRRTARSGAFSAGRLRRCTAPRGRHRLTNRIDLRVPHALLTVTDWQRCQMTSIRWLLGNAFNPPFMMSLLQCISWTYSMLNSNCLHTVFVRIR